MVCEGLLQGSAQPVGRAEYVQRMGRVMIDQGSERYLMTGCTAPAHSRIDPSVWSWAAWGCTFLQIPRTELGGHAKEFSVRCTSLGLLKPQRQRDPPRLGHHVIGLAYTS